MRMLSKYFFIFTVLAVMSLSVYSVEFNVEISAVKDQVFPGEIGEFVLTITNNDAAEKFFIYTQSAQPGWFTQKDYSLVVSKEGMGITTIYATPSKDALSGNHGFFVYVYPQSDSTEPKRTEAFVTVLRNESLILGGLTTNKGSYSVGEEIKVFSTARSVVRRNVVDFSFVFNFAGEIKTMAIPLVRGGENFEGVLSFNVPERIIGDVPVRVALVDQKGDIVEEREVSVNIPAVEKISQTRVEKDRLLWKSFEIIVKNEGNVGKDKVVVVEEISPINSLLLSSSDQILERTREGGKNIVVWEILNIEPGEEIIINYRINYYVLYLVVLLLAVVIYVALKEFRSVSIHKKSYRKGKVHTIHIHLLNRSSKRVNKVKIKDFVSDTCAVVNKFEFVQPDVRKGSEGVTLTWGIGSLESGEERIVTYHFVPKVKVEQEVELSRAEMTFIMNNKRYKLRSNVVRARF